MRENAEMFDMRVSLAETPRQLKRSEMHPLGALVLMRTPWLRKVASLTIQSTCELVLVAD